MLRKIYEKLEFEADNFTWSNLSTTPEHSPTWLFRRSMERVVLTNGISLPRRRDIVPELLSS